MMAENKEDIEKILKKSEAALQKLIEQGKLPPARGMTRKERKTYDATGFNPVNPKAKDKSFYELNDESTDWILENVYKGFDFDDLQNNIVEAFVGWTKRLTYGDYVGEKN